ncbi:MAG: lysophospholipid acyltransferase family protein [Candidatus Brocadiaceae bacterium]|nr:lysophospholipid acyltransferase family protein [Candidatus Brocadiaceae bacterium]
MKKLKFLLVGILGSWLIRVLAYTIRIEDMPRGFNAKVKGVRGVFTVWHCMMLLLASVGRNSNIQILISRHSDGEYIAQVARRLGLGVVRGSTTRGGSGAVKALVDRIREGCSVAITPDGPRGPRCIVQPGSIYVSQKTGLPIIPVALGLSRFWTLPSWDKFRIPKPFSRALVVYGDPIYIPSVMTDEEMERYRLLVETHMKDMAEKADRLVRKRQTNFHSS